MFNCSRKEGVSIFVLLIGSFFYDWLLLLTAWFCKSGYKNIPFLDIDPDENPHDCNGPTTTLVFSFTSNPCVQVALPVLGLGPSVGIKILLRVLVFLINVNPHVICFQS